MKEVPQSWIYDDADWKGHLRVPIGFSDYMALSSLLTLEPDSFSPNFQTPVWRRMESIHKWGAGLGYTSSSPECRLGAEVGAFPGSYITNSS